MTERDQAETRLANARAELLELTIANRKRGSISTTKAIRYMTALADRVRKFDSGSRVCDARLSEHVTKITKHLIGELHGEQNK